MTPAVDELITSKLVVSVWELIKAWFLIPIGNYYYIGSQWTGMLNGCIGE